jgi:predicted metal-dependent hydrolase
MTIIERDVAFYAREVERQKDSLMRCPFGEESESIELIGAAIAARDALAHYAKLLARKELAR